MFTTSKRIELDNPSCSTFEESCQASKPEQPGLSSSTRLEVMHVQMSVPVCAQMTAPRCAQMSVPACARMTAPECAQMSVVFVCTSMCPDDRTWMCPDVVPVCARMTETGCAQISVNVMSNG